MTNLSATEAKLHIARNILWSVRLPNIFLQTRQCVPGIPLCRLNILNPIPKYRVKGFVKDRTRICQFGFYSGMGCAGKDRWYSANIRLWGLMEKRAKRYANGEQEHDGYLTRSFRLRDFRCDPSSQHDGIELFRSSSDPQMIRVGRKDCELKSGTLIVLNASIPHGVARGNGSFTSLTISSDRVSEALEGTGIDPKRLDFKTALTRETSTLEKSFCAVFSSRDVVVSDPFVADSALTSLLAELMVTVRHNQSHKILRLVSEGAFPNLVDKAKAILHDLAFEPDFDLSELARLSGCTKFHLIRRFKQKTGVTPVRYRNLLRIAAAKKSLAKSNLPIAAIAYEVGFGDLSTFNKAFLQVVGMSPSMFRKAINS